MENKLVHSYALIREVVESSVNFQGRLVNVVIDELQFGLNLCGVSIWMDGKILASNMSHSEAEFLDQHFAELAQPERTYFDKVHVSESESPPLEAEAGPSTMRTILRATTRRYSARVSNWRFDLYYRPEYLIPELSEYIMVLDSPSHSEFCSFLVKSSTLIGKRIRQETDADVSLRFLSQVGSSQYLKIILGKLRSSVLDHLQEQHPAFAQRSEFLVQYFIAYHDEQDRKVLRYFPLSEELAQLTDQQNVENVTARLREQNDELPPNISPRDFITKYDWVSTSSFVAYALDTRCAIYLGDWKNEPLVQSPIQEPD
ncbi:MAG: hypothetical protein ACRER2_10940 [Methylococcales bacterium]